MSVDTLKEHLKTELKNLYLFFGEEDYLKKYYLGAIEKKIFTDENFIYLNKFVFEGKVDFKELGDATEGLPAFADRKLIIVKNSGLFKSKKKSEKDNDKKNTKKDELSEYLTDIPDYACIIFVEEEIDKRMKTIDIIKKKGLMVEFEFQKPGELIKWVVKVFKSYNKDIEGFVASQLVEYSEQGMNEVLNEIQKVSLYVGERNKIISSDIEKVCTKSVKSRIFDLTDAISEKDGKKALMLLNDMISLKEPIPKILFMITRQIRQVLQMKIYTSKGMSVSDAASKIGLTPFGASKISKQAAHFTIEKLKEAINLSLEYDLSIKTGRLNDMAAVNLLIAFLTEKK